MPPTTTLSDERIQESSDDESSVSSDAGQESMIESRRAEKTSKTNPSARDSLISEMSSDESDASESSSTSSRSSTSAGSKRKATETAKATLKSPAKKSKPNLSNVKRVESATYVPPQGYTANKMRSSEITSQAQSIFKDLDGKQVWQISAPASFPISKLESLDVQAALNGEPLLQHNKISYTMSRGSTGETALLTPKPNGDYVCTATISQAFNIRGGSDATTRMGNGTIEDNALSQSTQHDGSATAAPESNVFFATEAGQKKPPREQPDNLRARYIPYGVASEMIRTENEEFQDRDVQMADLESEPAGSTPTRSQTTPKSSKKQKTKKTHSPELIVEETPSKRKKEKHAVSSSQVELSGGDSSQKKRKEKSKK